jgi:hypothetical protein
MTEILYIIFSLFVAEEKHEHVIIGTSVACAGLVAIVAMTVAAVIYKRKKRKASGEVTST